MEKINDPHFSVIIPTRNEETTIGNCLKALLDQTTGRSYEIIIVDTDSQDLTRKIAKQYGAHIFSETRPGKSIAFQTGVKNARGKILCFTEADCIVPPNWLETIDKAFRQSPDAAAVTGGYTLFDSTRWYRFLVNVFLPLSIYGYRILFGHHSLRCSNFAIYKSMLEQIGGFNTKTQEMYDVELSQRVKAIGRIYYLPTMRIQTRDRRFRGRLLRFIKEFLISFMTVAVFKKQLQSRVYEDIR